MKSDSYGKTIALNTPIRELRFGIVVQRKTDFDYGHLQGFTRDENDNLLLLVVWSRKPNSIFAEALDEVYIYRDY